MNTRASAKVQMRLSPAGVQATTTAAWAWLDAHQAAALWVIVSLGALLRLATLGALSLWLDEGLSYWIADRSLGDLLAYLAAHDTHPPLHYLLLQPMIALGGSEWLLRLPSAVAGIIAIPLLYALGRELFDRPTGLVAALLLAVSPLHIWHAQEARMYALVAMLTLAATLFAARAVRTGRRLDWAGLVICQAAALWSNTAAIWYTLALNAAALLLVRALWQRGRFWPWTLSQALAVGLWLPWMPTFLQQVRVSGSNNTWIVPATVQQVALTLAAFVSQSSGLMLQLTALGLLAACLALGSAMLFQESRSRVGAYVLLGCLVCVPIGLAFLISQPYVAVPGMSAIFRPGSSIFLTRNLIIASPPLLLVVARGLALAVGAGDWRRWAAAGLVTALVTLNLITLADTLARPDREDWRTAAARLAARAERDDLIIFVPPYIEGPFVYYYQRLGGAGVPRGYPHDDWAVHPRFGEYPTPAAALAGHQRYWLIISSAHDTIDGRLADDLAAQGQLIDHEHARGLTMRLYTLREGTQ
ncbi:MAG: glycosyltransferase family 39 protein [Chloroflexi bacterium]|nr:glycosyltransferase family 39 protein [Chloroflexota bacterium]